MKRTDVHRPSAIIPANYEQWNDYSLAGSDGVPPMGVDCAMPFTTYDAQGRATGVVTPTCADSGRCCVRSTERHARAEGRAIYGQAGRCGVCGAYFRHGSMFKHEPTGEIVHMGHDCAQKYGMMIDLSAFEIEQGRHERAHATAITRAANAAKRDAFCDAHPGLSAALDLADEIAKDTSRVYTSGERILIDLASKFMRFCELSEKQVDLAWKLANEIRNPVPPKAEELHVDAPTGKGVSFTGEIVSAKIHISQYGSSWKVTIKVTTEGGSWLAWGTAPRGLMDLVVDCVEAQEKAKRDAWVAEAMQLATRGVDPGTMRQEDRAQLIRNALKGLHVAVKATLERPQPRDLDECETDGLRAKLAQRNNERHFVFMKRPTITPAVYGPIYRAPKGKAAAS